MNTKNPNEKPGDVIRLPAPICSGEVPEHLRLTDEEEARAISADRLKWAAVARGDIAAAVEFQQLERKILRLDEIWGTVTETR